MPSSLYSENRILMRDVYSGSILTWHPKTFVLVLLIFLALWLLPSGVFFVSVILSIHALRGAKESIQALTILSILILLNPGLFPTVYQWSTLRWIVLSAAFGRMLWDGIIQSAPTPITLIRPLYVFGLSVVVLALISSHDPLISIFKITAFTIGVSTVMTSFHRTAHLRDYWISWLFTVSLAVIVASLPLYLSSFGYFRNGIGFQGILNHPQTYGPFAAPFTALLTSLILFRKDYSRLVILGASLGWIAIFTSLARTGLVMATIGILLAAFCHVLSSRRFPKPRTRARSVPAFVLGLMILGIVVVAYGDQILSASSTFILKQDSGGKSASFEIRKLKLPNQLENFATAPLSGIGFGVDIDPESFQNSDIGRTTMFGIPTGAPTEKSFLPTAILEETGIIGASLTILLIISLVRPVYAQGDLAALSVLISCLLINIAEIAFFSFGGIGLYIWIMTGLSYNMSVGISIPSLIGSQFKPSGKSL